jgi:hypothetical protein
MNRAGFVAIGGALVGLVLGCKPNLDQSVSIVTSTRVLAVQAVPAEAAPMSMVSYTALVVDPTGDVLRPAAQWNYCEARNPLANLGPVNPLCLQPGATELVVVGDSSVEQPVLTTFGGGVSATGSIPADACSQFGPNPPAPPPPMPGQPPQPPGRPVDPDPTGGYYAPVSYFVIDSQDGSAGPTVKTIYPSRISCGFANVDPVSASQLSARYHFNTNPSVASLTAGGMPLKADTTGTNDVTAGQKLQLEVAWPSSGQPGGCPLTDTCGDGICGADESTKICPMDCHMPPLPTEGCAGAERYVDYGLSTQSVVDLREGIHVAWYATGGTFDNDRTGRDGTDTTTTSDNAWQAPASPGPVHLWVVLADDRGGMGWSGYTLTVH